MPGTRPGKTLKASCEPYDADRVNQTPYVRAFFAGPTTNLRKKPIMKILFVLALIALTLAPPPALADSVKAGDLSIENPWARATPKGSPVGAGYLTIKNEGAAADRLMSVTVDFADVQVHEMKMTDGVMQMREISGGLEIPAHKAVTLAPNGNHLMFIGLKHPLAKGETVKATLSFEHAGQVAVDMPVLAVGAMGPGTAHDMKGMKM
jgi:periplasmic copper chaperone A